MKSKTEQYIPFQDSLLADESTAVTVQAKVESPAVQSPLFQFLGQLARDPAVDPAKLGQLGRELAELKEREERRDAEKLFNAAFARLVFPPIQKTAKAHNSTYAPYEEIQAVTTPILAAEGFSLSFTGGEPTAQGMIPIHGTLAHVAGHSIHGVLYVALDKSGSMNAIQGMGSSTAYGMRYLAKMMLNLRIVGDDDDAMSATEVLDDQQRKNVEDMIADCELDQVAIRGFLKMPQINAPSIYQIRKHSYDTAIDLLKRKKRKLEEERAK